MKAGNRISIDWRTFGSRWDDVEEYTVEEFRHTLGIFTSDERRESGEFTPLCELYTKGPESEKKYILMIKENYYILFMFRKWSVYMINYP